MFVDEENISLVNEDDKDDYDERMIHPKAG